MGNLWEAQRHEDKYSTGIPDVSYATDHHGWIELKSVDVRDESKVVKIPHFTAVQRAWAKRFGSLAGHTWLFVRVNRHYLLLGWWSVDRIGKLNVSGLRDEAVGKWIGKIHPKEFSLLLSIREDLGRRADQ